MMAMRVEHGDSVVQLRGVIFDRTLVSTDAQEAWLERCKLGGLKAAVCNSDHVSTVLQDWQLTPDEVLCVKPLTNAASPSHSAHGSTLWVAPTDAQAPVGFEAVVQALVSTNKQRANCSSSTGRRGDAGGGTASGGGMGAQPAPDAAVDAAAAAGADGRVQGQAQLLVVGYVMKPSRERQLAQAGLIRFLPRDGVVFVPLRTAAVQAPLAGARLQQQQGQGRETQQRGQQPPQQRPPPEGQSSALAQQLQGVDIVLHKASDDLVLGPGGLPSFGPSTLELQRQLEKLPRICVVDRFEAAARVLDRAVVGQLLAGLEGLALPGGALARAPRSAVVASFDDGAQLAADAAGVPPPFIVKPLVACGLAASHSMALVLTQRALAALAGGSVPCPALVQEFVNHGGTEFKVYVMGERVFYTPRSSIPDIAALPECASSIEGGPHPGVLYFDSLQSRPTQLPPHLAVHGWQPQQQLAGDEPGGAAAVGAPAAAPRVPDQAVVEAIAAYLRRELQLHLFGFDVVLASGGGGGGGSGHGGGTGCVNANATASSVDRTAGGGVGSAPGWQYLVIDVNYFPNYRGGGEAGAACFRSTLRDVWQRHVGSAC